MQRKNKESIITHNSRRRVERQKCSAHYYRYKSARNIRLISEDKHSGHVNAGRCVSVCQNADVLWEPTTRVHSCFPAAGAQQKHWSTFTKPNYLRYVLKSLSNSRKSLHKLCFFVFAKVGFGVAFLYLFILFIYLPFFSLSPSVCDWHTRTGLHFLWN